ncbi:response regulator [Sphingosinicella microcystinivorans]|nr:response regulator [Sphingosinicella microcystinivorans]
MDALPRLIWTMDTDGGVKFVGNCRLEYAGRTRSMGRQTALRSLKHSGDRRAGQKICRETFEYSLSAARAIRRRNSAAPAARSMPSQMKAVSALRLPTPRGAAAPTTPEVDKPACPREYNEDKMKNKNTVGVVDDDESVRESLPDLLESFGFQTQAFESAEDFLQFGDDDPGCLILDIAMPGMSGPELQQELARQERDIPIVFISAHAADLIPALLEKGAVACLAKPFSEEELVDAVRAALARN